MNIIPGVSFTHVPDPSQPDFRYSCTGDSCGTDPSCSSPGYRNDGNVWSSPDVVALRAVTGSGGSCTAVPGSTIKITVTLTNVGDQSAFNVVYSDPAFEFATLIPGTVRINGNVQNCVISSGNSMNDTRVEVQIPELCICSDEALTITYEAVVMSTFPCINSSVAEEVSQGLVTWTNGPVNSTVTTSDPSVSDAPNVVTYCLSDALSVTFSNSDAVCVEPGQNFTGSFVLTSVGDTSTCSISASLTTSNVGSVVGLDYCILDVEGLGNLNPGGSFQGSSICHVTSPYPNTNEVNVITISANDDSSSYSSVTCVTDSFAALKVGGCGITGEECCTQTMQT